MTISLKLMNDFFISTWLPFLYLYGVGGILFFFGLILIVKTKALQIKDFKDFNWFLTLIIGFIYYLLIHFSFIILAF